MNKSNEEKDFITFDDLEFIRDTTMGKAHIARFNNGLSAFVIELDDYHSKSYDAKYELSVSNEEGKLVCTKLSWYDQISRVDNDEDLSKALKEISQLTKDEVFLNNDDMHDYYYIKDKAKTTKLTEKEFITFDNLEFEENKDSFCYQAVALFDNGMLCIKRVSEDDDGFHYTFTEYDKDGHKIEDATYNVFNQNKVFINKLLQKIQCKYGNGNLPEESVIERNFNPSQTLTIDDLKFDRINDMGEEAKVDLDTGLIARIVKLNKEKCENPYDREPAELAAKYMYRISICDFAELPINEKLEDNGIGTKNNYGIFLKDDNELNKALIRLCLLDEYGNPSKEKTETTKSTEKEDRAKQSLDRIRTKKKSVSGVYVADKIGEAIRSGVVSETVTPEKGKQLSDNIKKKYIMDRQQKS